MGGRRTGSGTFEDRMERGSGGKKDSREYNDQ